MDAPPRTAARWTDEARMPFDRRQLLQLGAATAAVGAMPGAGALEFSEPMGAADHTLRIASSLVELAPDKIIATKT
jgi:hypothetical protein